jgi:hypothetical protein
VSAGIRQKLEGDKSMQVFVFALVNHAHAAATQFLDNAVVRDSLANHWRESYVREIGKSMRAKQLAGPYTDCW